MTVSEALDAYFIAQEEKLHIAYEVCNRKTFGSLAHK